MPSNSQVTQTLIVFAKVTKALEIPVVYIIHSGFHSPSADSIPVARKKSKNIQNVKYSSSERNLKLCIKIHLFFFCPDFIQRVFRLINYFLLHRANNSFARTLWAGERCHLGPSRKIPGISGKMIILYSLVH